MRNWSRGDNSLVGVRLIQVRPGSRMSCSDQVCVSVDDEIGFEG